jgi:hypothetical protein
MLNIGGLSKKGTQVNTHFGTIVHEMLDQVYQNLDEVPQENVLEFVRGKLESYLEKNRDKIYVPTEQNDIEKEMAIAILEGYFKFFAADRENFSEITPEYEFAFPYGDVLLRGKVDGIARLRKKDRWQLEHKTKSRVDEEGIQQMLQFDFQNLMYSFVLDSTNVEPIKGVLYNIIRKPQLRKGKDEAASAFLDRIRKDIAVRPEWYFIRYEVVYSNRDKSKFKEQLDGALSELQMFIAGKLPDLQNQAQCLMPYKCEYIGVCSAGITEGLEIRDTVHPELDTDFKPDPRILQRYNICMD